ncbi:fimbrial protein [Morganella morganii]|uniref:fimbrial protein n=1 Tax=Morganella morganii TaxID=582 RepID=UPI000D1EDB6F|nr:fimbrial protein [Morganella morganii]HAE77072.1 hypothetical protein [Morganella sp. (in: enterobacteria)]QXO41474.1 fimbrial protein [Morganella morganii]QXO45172.1 fimbrial protein [Morganella morganii]QXO48677.1 fimbrial protein [Morganella morganii]QXO52542.1 fimbrial protein [Morganella morganii]
MKKYILYYFLFFYSLSGYASDTDNTCWDLTSSNNFNVQFTGGSFTSNNEGALITVTYSGVPSYNILCKINYPATVPGGSQSEYYHNHQTRTNFLPSEAGNGFLKVNEDFDIFIWHFVSGKVPSNGIVNWEGKASPANITNFTGYNLMTTDFGADTTSPYLQLRLRRTQIGGVLHIPGGIQLFRTYDNVFRGAATGIISNDAATMTVSTMDQFIPLPVMCQINSGQPINVDFGDIDNSLITRDGSRYVKTVPLKYNCNTPINQDISINLSADAAAFSSDVIASSLPDDIGIIVKHNGVIMKPAGSFRSVLVNGQGSDDIQVAPVINDPSKSVTGDFTASAALVITII